MNRFFIVSALAVAAAATMSVARADDITIDPHPFVSTRTVGEVRNELQQYKAAGVNPWSTSYNPLAAFHSTTTRAQVTADFLAARDEVAALGGEDSGSMYLTAHARRSAAPTNLAGN